MTRDTLPGFLAELKRRKVVRVGVVYGSVAFAVLEGIDLLASALDLPPSITTTVAVAVVLGFPIALSLAWAFQLSPEGMRRVTPAPGETQTPTGWLSGHTILLVAAFLAVGISGWLVGRFGSPFADRPRSIAVLPCDDMSPDQNHQYFSSGLTEELIGVLAAIPELRVAGRTSSFAVRARAMDVQAIGRSLNVAAVLECSVRREADSLRISTQLLDTGSGFEIWSDVYDRDLEGVFAVQEEIAAAIAEQLRTPLGLESPPLVRHRTEGMVYELYLRGRDALRHRSSAADVRLAIDFFERSIARDATFGPAHASLAEAYALLPYFGGRWEGNLASAEVAANTALSLDSTHAEAHLAIANVLRDRWEWERAAIEYEKALSLNPDYPDLYQEYSEYMTHQGRFDEGIRLIERGYELDPLSPPIGTQYGWALGVAGRTDEGVEVLGRVLEANPGMVQARWALMHILMLASRREAAEEEARRLDEIAPARTMAWADRVAAHFDVARRSAAIDAFVEIRGGAQGRVRYLAWFEATELALEALAEWLAETPFGATDVVWDPLVRRALERDPAFHELRVEMGFSRQAEGSAAGNAT